MDFLEKDLEQVIYEATDDQLSELGLFGRRFRQLRIGNYGIADLVFVERDYTLSFYPENKDVKINNYGLKITVCELKKDKIGISAFLQAVGYCKGIARYLEKRQFRNFYFEILLMGRDLDTSGSFPYITDLFHNHSDECKFSNGVNSVHFYTYKYGFNGIKFSLENGYKIINNNF